MRLRLVLFIARLLRVEVLPVVEAWTDAEVRVATWQAFTLGWRSRGPVVSPPVGDGPVRVGEA